MAKHYQQLPDNVGFPNAADMKRWQEVFDDLVPGGNTAELVGFEMSDDGQLMGVCTLKGKL